MTVFLGPKTIVKVVLLMLLRLFFFQILFISGLLSDRDRKNSLRGPTLGFSEVLKEVFRKILAKKLFGREFVYSCNLRFPIYQYILYGHFLQCMVEHNKHNGTRTTLVCNLRSFQAQLTVDTEVRLADTYNYEIVHFKCT